LLPVVVKKAYCSSTGEAAGKRRVAGSGPPYTKKEEADFYGRNANGPVTSGAVMRGSPKHRSIRRRQSQRAPKIKKQPRPKADKDSSGFFAALIDH
jgi:hypothetical protein